MSDDEKATETGAGDGAGGDRLRACMHLKKELLGPYAIIRVVNAAPRDPEHYDIATTVVLCPFCTGHALALLHTYERAGAEGCR